MKITIGVLIILFGISSCGSFSLMNRSNPSKKSFKYYNKYFQLNNTLDLEIGKKYIRQGRQGVFILVFFSDGFINQYFTTSIDSISGKRSESGVVMGYYKIQEDSIFFTTKSYYQYRQTYYKGFLNNDTIYLEVKYPKVKNIEREEYILFKE